jgi:hypothetical protein
MKSIYDFLNCKRKLLHCNTNINVNKICLKNEDRPNIHIKTVTHNITGKKTYKCIDGTTGEEN